MRYLCASEVNTRILELRMYMTDPTVNSLSVHLPIPPTVPRKGASKLEQYFQRPLATVFDEISFGGKDNPNTSKYIPGLWEAFIITTDKPKEAYIASRKKVDASYQQAATALRLLDDVDEAFLCLQEAVHDQYAGSDLLRLFVILLRDGWPVNQILTAKPGDDKYEEKHEIYDALTLEFFQLTNSAPLAKQMLLQYIYDFITDNTSLTMEH